MIHDLQIIPLITHPDERGFFRELLRMPQSGFSEMNGQISHSMVQTGVLKAWHGHRRQSQWTYILNGDVQVAIADIRTGSPTAGECVTMCLGDRHPPVIYCIPPGVVHGYRILAGPVHVIYLTSGTYDPSDEIRLSPDDSSIPYRWNE